MRDLALILQNNTVISVEDKSDFMMQRMRLTFANGYQLSIIQGEYSYGGNEGLFEISPIDKSGNLNGKLLDFDYDDVLGHLTKEQVKKYAQKLANLP